MLPPAAQLRRRSILRLLKIPSFPDTIFADRKKHAVHLNAMHMQHMIPPALYVVATPIGNLRDITLRALDTLAAVDVIAAEDTRTTAKLLAHYAIQKRMLALHCHNETVLAEKLVALIADGKRVALVTDAGTPAISDPGSIVVSRVRNSGHDVIPVPGANAAVCALSAIGTGAPQFLFYGFLPSGAGARKRHLEALKTLPYAIVFYEAPHRLTECIADLAEVLGPLRQIAIAKELTKMFETIHICPLGDALSWVLADPHRQKGEFVLVVSGHAEQETPHLNALAEHALQLLMRELPLKQAVKLAAEISGESRKRVYAQALAQKSEAPHDPP